MRWEEHVALKRQDKCRLGFFGEKSTWEVLDTDEGII
jgi:hypothetical protein